MTERQDARRRADDEGAIGIGTMIVFIAMVIVAAVAAAVLINTAGSLQRQSAETGQETTQEVSGNIFVRDIVGNVSSTTGNIQNVSWYVSLAPGADPIDLQLMNIRWEHGENLTDFRHVDRPDVAATECDTVDDWSSNTSAFCVEPILDVGDDNPNVLSGGDRAKIYVTLEDGGSWTAQISTRDSVDALLMPEKGTPVDAGFNTPATFGQRSNLSLK